MLAIFGEVEAGKLHGYFEFNCYKLGLWQFQYQKEWYDPLMVKQRNIYKPFYKLYDKYRCCVKC